MSSVKSAQRATTTPPLKVYPRAPTPWDGLSDYVVEADLEVGEDTGLLEIRQISASYNLGAEAGPRRERVARGTEPPVLAQAVLALPPPPSPTADPAVARLAVIALVLAATTALLALVVALG